MPSQVISMIHQLFPELFRGDVTSFTIKRSGELQGLVDLITRIPQELIVLTPEHYAKLIVGVGSIQNQLRTWKARGAMKAGVVKWDTMVQVLNALELCPDEYPPQRQPNCCSSKMKI